MARSALALAVALVTLLLAAPGASAHAILLRADPAIGSVTPTAPTSCCSSSRSRWSRSSRRSSSPTAEASASRAARYRPATTARSLVIGAAAVRWPTAGTGSSGARCRSTGTASRACSSSASGMPGRRPRSARSAGGGAALGSIVLRWVTLMSLILGVRPRGVPPARRPVRRRRLGPGAVADGGDPAGLIVIALVATPLYVSHETALFGYKSLLDVGWIAENLRSTAFGRGYTDLVAIIAVFAALTVLALRTGRRWLGVARGRGRRGRAAGPGPRRPPGPGVDPGARRAARLAAPGAARPPGPAACSAWR